MNDISQLIEEYSIGAKLLRDALQSTPDSDLDTVPVAGKWSMREAVCHLADAEIIYADRMKRIIAEDSPTFFEADPNVFVPALYCSQRTLEAELNVVSAVRAHMLPILQTLATEDYQRTGEHSLDGTMTLQTLLQRITDHIPHHLTFIHEKIAALKL